MFAVDELSTDVLQQALRAGARDAVVIGGEASLHQSVDRVGELLAGAVDRARRRRPPATRTGEPGSPDRRSSRPRAAWARPASRSTSRSAMAKRSDRPGGARRRRPPVRRRLGDARPPAADTPCSTPPPPCSTATSSSCRSLAGTDDDSGLLVLPAPIEPMPTDALLPGEMVNICRALQAGRRPRRRRPPVDVQRLRARLDRSGRRGAPGRAAWTSRASRT